MASKKRRDFFNTNLLVTIVFIGLFVWFGFENPDKIAAPGYFIGALFGTLIIPIILWFIYLIVVYVDNNAVNKESYTLSKHPEVGPTFTEMYNAIVALKKTNVITDEDAHRRIKNLKRETNEYLAAKKNKSEKEQQLEQLEKAFKLGVVSEEEYHEKKEKINPSLSSNKVQFDKTKCPVCKAPLSPKDKECPKCGLQMTVS